MMGFDTLRRFMDGFRIIKRCKDAQNIISGAIWHHKPIETPPNQPTVTHPMYEILGSQVQKMGVKKKHAYRGSWVYIRGYKPMRFTKFPKFPKTGYIPMKSRFV